MLKIIKKFFKILFIIILIIFFSALGYYQYKKMKTSGSLYKLLGKTDNSSNISSVSTNSTTSNNLQNNVEESKNSNKFSLDIIDFSSEGESLIKNNNYDEYYNKFNFDNVILLYEGNQENARIKELLDRLIQNADDPLYTKPAVNINGFNIDSDNLENYKSDLRSVKNSLNSATYKVSFEYNKIKAIVNKIIITKI